MFLVVFRVERNVRGDTAALTFADHSPHHCNNQLVKSCALVTAVKLELDLGKNGRVFAEEEKIVTYKHFGFVRFSFPVKAALLVTFVVEKWRAD